MTSLDLTLSPPPSQEELARALAGVVDDVDEDLAREVIDALQGAEVVHRPGAFERQLGRRLEQARIRAEREDRPV